MKVYDLGLFLFYRAVFKNPQVGPRFIEILLSSMQMFERFDRCSGNTFRDRAGKIINGNIVTSLIKMLVNLGTQQLNIYEAEFETKYLQEATLFYRAEAKEMVLKFPISNYLKKVRQRRSIWFPLTFGRSNKG